MVLKGYRAFLYFDRDSALLSPDESKSDVKGSIDKIRRTIKPGDRVVSVSKLKKRPADNNSTYGRNFRDFSTVLKRALQDLYTHLGRRR